MLRPLIVSSVLLLSAALAGCLTPPPEDAAEASTVLPPPDESGKMTLEDEGDDSSVQPCLLGSPLTLLTPDPYCATRRVTLGGDLTLTSLPVTLSAIAADISLETAEPGAWALEVTILASGATEDAARQAAEDFEILVDIGAPGAHALDAAIEPRSDSSRASVDVVLSLPAATLYELGIETGSGDVRLSGIRTTVTTVDTGSGDVDIGGDWLAALLDIDTGSGDVSGEVDAATVNVDTGSGDISLAIAPTAPGALALATGSGDIALKLADDRTHAYDLTATTGSGDITFDLDNGDAQTSENSGRFTTTGAAPGAFRTTGVLSTGSGDIAVSGK